MNYNLLRTPSDPKIIGVRNGMGQVEINEKLFVDKDQYQRIRDFFSGIDWVNRKRVPDFEIHLNATILPNAKLTDFLKFSPYFFASPFMINKKGLKIFEEFNIQKHYLFPVTLFDSEGNPNLDYQLFYCPLLEFSIIDFPKSIFFTGSELIGKEFHRFVSEQEFTNHYKINNKLIQISKMVMNNTFDSSLDFFVGRIGGMHVSDSLRDAIEENKLTGVKIFSNKEPSVFIQ